MEVTNVFEIEKAEIILIQNFYLSPSLGLIKNRGQKYMPAYITKYIHVIQDQMDVKMLYQ